MNPPASARRRRLLVTVASVAVAVSAIWASTAGAAFHLIKVREVHPGMSNDSYVVLQMLQAGEGFVGGHSLRVYDANGAIKHTFTFTPGGAYSTGYFASNDNHGNNTILVGDTGVEATFGVRPDDHTEAGLEIDGAGGAVCWLDGQPPDCVSWGNFAGNGALPAPGAGSPTAAIPQGQAIRRTISPNCPTYLESADDSNDSAVDFSQVFPDPRPNSEPPTERPCTSTTAQPGQDGQSPPSSSTPRRGTAIAAGIAVVRGGRALLRVRCRGQRGARCRGALRLFVRTGGRRSARSSATRRIVIGRARYRIAARRARVVRVRLTRRGRRQVRRAGRRGLRAKLAGRRLRNRVVILRAPARGKRNR